MWKRTIVKKEAKKHFKSGSWRMIAVCFLIAALTTTYPLATTFFHQYTPHIQEQAASAYIPDYSNSEVLNNTIIHISHDFNITQILDNVSFQIADILIDLYSSASSAVFSVLRVLNSFFAETFSLSTLFLLLGMVLACIYQLFISNILRVGEARFFLEFRNYSQTGISKIFYLYKLRYLLKPAWVMFCRSAFQFLWNLTIAGGIIKHYEYSMIPFILAENPAVGRKNAFYLSKQLTHHNKWKLFLLDISFLGWKCLSFLTLGVLDIVFVNPYIACTKAELYMTLRRNYVLSRSPLYEKLNDAALEHVLSEDELLISKALYDDSNGPYTKTAYFAPNQYPAFLYSIQPPEYAVKMPLKVQQKYSFLSLYFLFFVFSVFGWLFETGVTLLRDGTFTSRTFLIGPWIPLYGICGFCILAVMYKFSEKPILVFLSIAGIYSLLAYAVNWIVESEFHVRLWNYEQYFLNINGRIYIGGSIEFALLGCAFLYSLAPRWNRLFLKLKRKKRIWLCILLTVLFAADVVFSLSLL
ncbi:DUF975 family protein [Mediterraneibacter massiliensis]|uniref:DUF975 family protein n=1 Tax=Mediterraneibacter massiliensis TaxID=1720300 RepID=UPI00073EDB41|nr:DUF975 family protein [Mediterraneibacter massiliensis]